MLRFNDKKIFNINNNALVTLNSKITIVVYSTPEVFKFLRRTAPLSFHNSLMVPKLF